MKKLVLSALVVAALAGTASAQNTARLELRLVRQIGTPANPGASNPVVDVVDPANTVISTSGTQLRFELQYRIFDLTPDDDNVPAGLSSSTMNITSGSGTLLRAQLSRSEASGAANDPQSPDISGLPIGTTTTTDPAFSGANSARRGLHTPFRGGMANASLNDLPSNGIVNVDTNPDPNLYAPGAGNTLLQITPLAISQPNQGASVGNEATWYGVYSFNYIVGGSNDQINVAAIADSQTGNRFGYFADGNPVPITSTAASGTFYNIIVPAPGAAALVGLGGLLVARRRRA